MVDPRLEQYISSKRQSGASDESIKLELIANRWNAEIVNESLGLGGGSSIPTPTPDHYYGIGELLSNAFSLFKERFVGSFLLTLFPGVIIFLVSLVFGVLYAILSGGIMSLLNNSNGIVTGVLIGVGLLVVFIAIVIMQIWSSIALLYSLLSVNKISFIQSFKDSWKYVRRFWWISALEMLIIFGGSIFLLIPGIILGIWFSFSQFVLIDEDIKGMAALQTSREYVRGYGWSIFARMLLYGFTIGIIGGILGGIAKGMGIDKNIVVSIISALLNMALAIFSISLATVMYKNIKSVKGKVSIEGKSKKGYIALAVIGVLSILLIPIIAVGTLLTINPTKQINKARKIESLNNQMEIKKSIEMYYAQVGKFPNDLNQLVPKYLKSIPVDPNIDSCYSVTIVDTQTDIQVTSAKKIGAVCDTKITVPQ
jgi:hypothetical protein